MEFFEKLRVTAGILCIAVAILRIVLFFVDGAAAVAYSAFFIDWNEAIGLIEGFAMVIMAFLFTIAETFIAVIIYIILGALLIGARKVTFISISCNIITAISIILSIRAIAIFADPSINQINIFLIILLIIYLTIFSTCLISYIRFRKEGKVQQ